MKNILVFLLLISTTLANPHWGNQNSGYHPYHNSYNSTVNVTRNVNVNGCGYGGYGYNNGWCGTGIPNGLGWALFGVVAGASLLTPTYQQPVYQQVIQQPQPQVIIIQR